MVGGVSGPKVSPRCHGIEKDRISPALFVSKLLILNGRGDRIRTYDPLLPKQMRYQAAPRPD